MKKILILGGCGYIGSALHTYLTPNHTVDTIDLEYFGNYSNPKNNRFDFDLVDKRVLDSYDVVILVAANSSVTLCKDLYDAFENNVNKFVRLVKKLNKQKFIYASSSCVYVTLDDRAKIETDELSPMDGLTFTKTAIDQFMPLTDVEYYGLRFGSVNGFSPNTRLDLMINGMTFTALNKKEVNVFNGHAHRPILSINDLCRAVDAIVSRDKDNRGIYNVASVNHTITEIGQRVADFMQVPLIDKGNNYTYDFTIDSTKFCETFDFKFTDTIESISKTLIDNAVNPLWQRREAFK